MSRRVLLFRDTVRGDLVARSPIHVGGLGAGLTDAETPVARDGLGRPILPGTALTGALRTALGEHGDLNLWGGTPKLGASLVTVFDAPAASTSGEVRWHASIDRRSGSAATNHLFSRELVPAGTRFTFRIDVETVQADEHENAQELLGQVVELLAGAGLQVGGSGSTGLGHVRLDPESIVSRCDDLTTAAGLLTTLQEASPTVEKVEEAAAKATTATEATDPPPDRLRITVKWRPRGPLMSKEARVGGVCDALPATVRDGDGYRLLLPGSSVKGALRSRAELIARTATGQSRIPPGFIDQMAEAARLPGVGALFGSAGNIAAGEQGNKGALTVHDTLSEVLLPVTEWEAVADETFTVEPATDDKQRWEERAFAKAVDALNDAIDGKRIWFDYAVRNAIDRWSGGVAKHRLFSSLEPYVGLTDEGHAWRPIVLDVDLSRLVRTTGTKTSETDEDARAVCPEARDAALALLLLTLADLEAGWVPLGYGTTRGLGAIKVRTITLAAPADIPSGSLPDALLDSLTRQGGIELDTLWPSAAEALLSGWQRELERYQTSTPAAGATSSAPGESTTNEVSTP
ncbi:MAG: RAMP superfamily CRISPR-associated protein [Micrococcales bacterium]|nr:RAMP superfamily CRISPR-associated protein [Micrococcales bacterium]